MKILVTDYAWEDLEIERKILAPLSCSLLVAKTGAEDELVSLATEAAGILTNWKPVTHKVIANAPKCQAIIRYGVGLDNIDVQFATETGVVVANVPDYCVEEVSDHALALLLALARRISLYDRGIKGGIYDLSAGTPMYRLKGKTLGIVGFGKIGKMVCRKAQGFGMHVIVHHRGTKANSVNEENLERVNFHELLTRSDYISVHVPLTSETRHLFNYGAFRRMKPTAFLVNTARGDVIDSDALLQALNDGLLRGAALDVLPKEPPAPCDPLLLHPRTIITPHAGFNSEESLQELRNTAASEMFDVLSGRIPKFVVNPGVLTNTNLRAHFQTPTIPTV